MTNISTKNIRSEEEHNLIDQMINLETQRKLSVVPNAKEYGVMTACFIDGEFVCVSDYEMDKSFINALKEA